VNVSGHPQLVVRARSHNFALCRLRTMDALEAMDGEYADTQAALKALVRRQAAIIVETIKISNPIKPA